MSNVIEFSCPHCSHNIRTNARYAGKKGTCPRCGKSVTVEADPEQMVQFESATPVVKPSTEANALLAGLIGAGATLLLYLALQNNQIAGVAEIVQSSCNSAERIVHSIGELKQEGNALNRDLQTTLTATAELQEQLGKNTASMTELASQWGSIQAAPEDSNGDDKMEKAIDSLNRSVDRLAEILTQPNSTGVKTGDGAPHRGRGLFGMFSKG